MPLRRAFFLICLILCALCLATGYGSAGQWLGANVALLLGPSWWMARKYPGSGLPFLCLSVSVGMAVIGSLTGAPSLWMIFGSTAALAAWDLLGLDSSLGHHPMGAPTRRYENQHLRTLLLALGVALFAIISGRFLEIQLPFFVLFLSLASLLFALDRIWSYLKRTGRL